MRKASVRKVDGSVRSRWYREYQRARSARNRSTATLVAAQAMPVRLVGMHCTENWHQFSGCSYSPGAIRTLIDRRGEKVEWRDAFIKNALWELLRAERTRRDPRAACFHARLPR